MNGENMKAQLQPDTSHWNLPLAHKEIYPDLFFRNWPPGAILSQVHARLLHVPEGDRSIRPASTTLGDGWSSDIVYETRRRISWEQ